MFATSSRKSYTTKKQREMGAWWSVSIKVQEEGLF